MDHLPCYLCLNGVGETLDVTLSVREGQDPTVADTEVLGLMQGVHKVLGRIVQDYSRLHPGSE